MGGGSKQPSGFTNCFRSQVLLSSSRRGLQGDSLCFLSVPLALDGESTASLGKATEAFCQSLGFPEIQPIWQDMEDCKRCMKTVCRLSPYYKGGFEGKMSKREASLVLGISATSTKVKVRDAHRKIMVLNHPDKGGSPYLAAKINEAKDLFDKENRH
ncbi:hypothetical protein KUCAC02_010380 [Chaenocephalus aceratus]|uniref:Uncharacterized protein n=1 Tax=Chaenocephalus aceratus TaxID=36190 RepID=A0ACB9VYV9_CHAAC|nr:hypothetical protein KUCAC02_010380 [Chaenocephalus aceratus]